MSDQQGGKKIEPAKPAEIQRNDMVVAEMLNYFIWLANQDPDFKITAGQIANMYQEGIRTGTYWSEVTEKLGLPNHPDWE